MSVKTATRLSVFPLTGALLFPRMHLRAIAASG
jgi:Lon protease-like protein